MSRELNEKLDKYMKDMLFYEDLPGLSVSLGWGAFSYKNSVGYSDFLEKDGLTLSKFFHMASLSKLFVAMGTIRLVYGGKLSLDDKLLDILPEFKVNDERLKDIDIRSLLTHTSGLGDVVDYAWDKPRIGADALYSYITSEAVSSGVMLCHPREKKFNYSNIGYEILGVVISKVSGVPFEEYIKDSIFKPLEMDNSEFLTFKRGEEILSKEIDSDDHIIRYRAEDYLDLNIIKKANGALPHKKGEDKKIVRGDIYPYNREHGPSSTLTTDVYDIEKWAIANIEKLVVDNNMYEEIWAPYTTVLNTGEGMGLGWFIREQNEETLYGHEGTDDGFRASFWICPKRKAYVCVMCNMSKSPVKKINKGIFDILCQSLISSTNSSKNV